MNYKAYAIFSCIMLISSFTYSQTSYFVKYKESVSRAQINGKISTKQFFNNAGPGILNKSNLTAQYFAANLGSSDNELSKIVKVTFTDSTSAAAFYQAAKNDPTIEYIEPSHIYKIDSVPNDSLVSKQWALEKIKAFDAWNITEGSDTVLIGVIDTGIDYFHPDLKNKIFINPGETGNDNSGKNKKTNGIDDDGNGFIDDFMGWDFTDRRGFPFDSSGGDYLGWDNNPMDENGHGTYIAGIIAAQTNNKIGIAGAAPNVKLLNIRAFDPSGYGEEDDVAAAILYAVKMGAKIINMSFGDSQFSYVLKDVIKYAYDRGVVLIASSGNSGSDEPHYPSGYSEVISVGNSTSDDYVASTSNYGSTLDLVAPGTDILTTAMGGGYSTVSGTSASAPFVSAAAGLILSLGNFTNEEVKQIIKSTADDINSPGWDEQSGAGRLNLLRAVSVVAPSIIKFNFPTQDYSTNSDSLVINASVLSAYFKSYSLYIGTGLNPVSWTSLIYNGMYQFDKKNIYSLNASSLPDTVYCLRLVVNLTTGFTSEERLNFYIERNPPVANLNFVEPALYGNKPTILASVSTNQPTRVRIYFRKTGTTDFNYVTLDGFATNIQTVKNDHYGFIPTNLIEPNSIYDVYFEAENLVGLTTKITDGNSYFHFNTAVNANLGYEKIEPYTLPAGSIYQNPVSITTGDSTEIFLRRNSNPSTTYLYKLAGDNFTIEDSLQNRIVKDVGDFNNNGKKDLLSFFVYNGFIEEQNAQGSSKFIDKFVDTTSKFWPIMASDLYNNSKTEILAIDSDTSFIISDVNTDLSLSTPIRLFNYTEKGTWNNYINAPYAATGDIDGSGKNEIWMIDEEGDIFSYLINGPGKFQKWRTISTGLESSSAYIAAGNYTGDEKKELAVLLSSPSGSNTIPFYKLLVLRFDNDSLNILCDQMLVNPSEEFNSQFNRVDNSIRFADIDNDGKDELILFVFPYSYIFKYENGTNQIISYKENINSSSVFVGDLNKNGVKEVGFPTSQGITFSEFTTSNIAATPYNLTGFSLDSASVKLNWFGSGSKYYIFRKIGNSGFVLIDSAISNQYTDTSVLNNTWYFYAVKSYDGTKQNNLSGYSNIISVYSHKPASLVTVTSNTVKSVIAKFSNQINTKIENLQSFYVINQGYPNSISANDQYSYLLTFDKQFNSSNYSLVINNLNDFYGSPVKPDTMNFFVDTVPNKSEFFIVSHEIINQYKIKIDFNLPVDTSTVMNKSNYTFTPANKVTGIQLSDDRKTVYLSLTGSKPIGSVGIEYTLKLSNILSSNESGRVEINSGAGSFVVLTGYAENLSGVYVYPSPVRINNGENKLMFANLPQMSKITIFDINGKKNNEIEDRSGKGGMEYNLKDLNGNFLSSGIYIYRIVKLDEQNHEVEEKIGKFAVLK